MQNKKPQVFSPYKDIDLTVITHLWEIHIQSRSTVSQVRTKTVTLKWIRSSSFYLCELLPEASTAQHPENGWAGLIASPLERKRKVEYTSNVPTFPRATPGTVICLTWLGSWWASTLWMPSGYREQGKARAGWLAHRELAENLQCCIQTLVGARNKDTSQRNFTSIIVLK